MADHPGFARVQGRIAHRLKEKDPSMSDAETHDRAGAILASSSRRASPKAKAANPRLRKI